MWQVRFVRNAVTSLLPFQGALRRVKRSVFGKSHHIDEGSVYAGGLDQIHLLQENGLELEGADILEIGTGWYPVIPLMLRLAGARHVYLSDTHRLLDAETLAVAQNFLLLRAGDLAERLNLSEDEVRSVLDAGHSGPLETRLADLGMSYHINLDYARVDWKADAIISHTVMEHIPPADIRRLLMEGRAVLNPGGLMSHGIDHSDHRAHGDRSLSRVDFLRYSDRAWRWLCLNPQDYTNRLRHADYVAMVRDAGFDVLFERALVDEGALKDISDLRLNARFAFHNPEDLAGLWSHIVARPGRPRHNTVLAQVARPRQTGRPERWLSPPKSHGSSSGARHIN
ncbi:MAG: class I SAM-dependent methyltransferase [Pseudomonadota bacterium]